ncbi:hypothetical protein ACFLQY_01265 [Verrucomicrobiota bacterium]
MKSDQYKLLKHLYDKKEVFAREYVESMGHKHSDHRDFYDLAHLICEGYIGSTGSSYDDIWDMACALQCFSQGDPPQEYKNIRTSGTIKYPTRWFLKPKGFLYVSERKEKFRERTFVAIIGIICAIISGTCVGWVSENYIAKSSDKKIANQKLQPTVKTPVESGDEQGTAAEL